MHGNKRVHEISQKKAVEIAIPESIRGRLSYFDKVVKQAQDQRTLLIEGFLAGAGHVENKHCLISPDYSKLTLTDKEPKIG